MGWGYEWNNEHSQERMTDTDFSFANYNEAEGRMQEYDRISDKSERYGTRCRNLISLLFMSWFSIL